MKRRKKHKKSPPQETTQTPVAEEEPKVVITPPEEPDPDEPIELRYGDEDSHFKAIKDAHDQGIASVDLDLIRKEPYLFEALRYGESKGWLILGINGNRFNLAFLQGFRDELQMRKSH